MAAAPHNGHVCQLDLIQADRACARVTHTQFIGVVSDHEWAHAILKEGVGLSAFCIPVCTIAHLFYHPFPECTQQLVHPLALPMEPRPRPVQQRHAPCAIVVP